MSETLIGRQTRNPNSQSTNTKGAFSSNVFTASTTEDYDGFRIDMETTASSAVRGALDVGYGANGAETILLGNWMFLCSSTNPTPSIDIPVALPTGTRIAMRVQYNGTTNSPIRYSLFGLKNGTFEKVGVTSIECLNFDTATTLPTTALAGNGSVVSTYGSYLEITSGLSAAISALALTPVTNNITASVYYDVKVAAGASSSEVDIALDIPARRVSGNDVGFRPRIIPSVHAASTRIAAAVAADTTTTTNKDLWVAVYAYYGTLTTSGASLVSTEDDVQYETRARSAASQIITVLLRDDAGDPMTGLDYTDVTCYLSTDGAAPSAQTLVDATVGAYTSLGFKEISAANMAGAYMFCPATLPSSGARATYKFTATGMRPATLHVDLVGSDPRATALTTSDIDAAEISVNVAKINDTVVSGTGTSGNPWGPV